MRKSVCIFLGVAATLALCGFLASDHGPLRDSMYVHIWASTGDDSLELFDGPNGEKLDIAPWRATHVVGTDQLELTLRPSALDTIAAYLRLGKPVERKVRLAPRASTSRHSRRIEYVLCAADTELLDEAHFHPDLAGAWRLDQTDHDWDFQMDGAFIESPQSATRKLRWLQIADVVVIRSYQPLKQSLTGPSEYPLLVLLLDPDRTTAELQIGHGEVVNRRH